MDEGGKGGHVSRVENDNHVLYVRAVLPDIISELCCNLAVALEKVLAGHTFLAWSSTGRDNVLGIGECLLRVNGPGNIGTFETAVAHLLCNSLYARGVDIIKTNVWGKTEHQCGLSHV